MLIRHIELHIFECELNKKWLPDFPFSLNLFTYSLPHNFPISQIEMHLS